MFSLPPPSRSRCWCGVCQQSRDDVSGSKEKDFGRALVKTNSTEGQKQTGKERLSAAVWLGSVDQRWEKCPCCAVSFYTDRNHQSQRVILFCGLLSLSLTQIPRVGLGSRITQHLACSRAASWLPLPRHGVKKKKSPGGRQSLGYT